MHHPLTLQCRHLLPWLLPTEADYHGYCRPWRSYFPVWISLPPAWGCNVDHVDDVLHMVLPYRIFPEALRLGIPLVVFTAP
jgi:hypothetical protein